MVRHNYVSKGTPDRWRVLCRYLRDVSTGLPWENLKREGRINPVRKRRKDQSLPKEGVEEGDSH